MTVAALVYIGSRSVQKVIGIKSKPHDLAADLNAAFDGDEEAFTFAGSEWHAVIPLREIERVLIVEEKVADDGEEG